MGSSTSGFYHPRCHQPDYDYTLCIDTFSIWIQHRHHDMVLARSDSHSANYGGPLFPGYL